MPNVRDILSRFRPAGAPGAGRAAVPADRRRELESELGPVLALLDGPSAERARVLAVAQRDAEQIVAAARSEADGILSAARRQADANSAELVRDAVAAARSQAAGIVAAGDAEAAAIRERARLRAPVLVGQAVALISEIAMLDSASGAPARRFGPAAPPGPPS